MEIIEKEITGVIANIYDLLFLLGRAWTGFLVINFTFVFTVKK